MQFFLKILGGMTNSATHDHDQTAPVRSRLNCVCTVCICILIEIHIFNDKQSDPDQLASSEAN